MASEDIFYIIMGILFIIIFLITTIFCSTIIITIICNWHLHCRSTSNLLTVNTCIAFLVFILSISIQVPSLFHSNRKQNNDRYSTFCRIQAYLLLFTCVTKMFSYLIQAISRYFITILYKHKKLLTYRMNVILIILNWTIGIIISTGSLISPVAFQYESESRFCVPTTKVFHTSFTLTVVAYMIPVSIIVTLYALILRHTTRANRVQPSTIVRGHNKRNLKVFQNILMLLGIVLIGGTPYLLCIILNKISSAPWFLYSVGILFIILSTAVESVTIFVTNKEVKRIVRTKLDFHRIQQMHVFTIATNSKSATNGVELNKTKKTVLTS